MKMRLQKFMARSGVASRRRSEEIIAAGRVEVNGETVTEMGVKIDPTTDTVRVDGEKLSREELKYIKLNKPTGVISSADDPRGRKTVVDYVDHLPQRLYPVGRLDYDSRGLILLTNDGDLTHILTHPSFTVTKVYRVEIAGILTSESLTRLETGIELEDGPTAPARLSQVKYKGGSTVFKLALHEGRNRQIRRMCKAVGHEVQDLVRLRIGPLALKDLAGGSWRELSAEEINELNNLKKEKLAEAERDKNSQEDEL
ncbi:ribosomal large subunit pseudouridine synthase B [Halarsenatibacter silvermanii]|uniref:Pseudouridine synthase n=2 Tax=Halarsenatibacter silvermanii TaxID=321763 RepID=A0A1G9PI66_9FIRM|nr:ribosomal large subunit pseudouridine synthase B [Halarsenatibacter silvermanii]